MNLKKLLSLFSSLFHVTISNTINIRFISIRFSLLSKYFLISDPYSLVVSDSIKSNVKS